MKLLGTQITHTPAMDLRGLTENLKWYQQRLLRIDRELRDQRLTVEIISRANSGICSLFKESRAPGGRPTTPVSQRTRYGPARACNWMGTSKIRAKRVAEFFLGSGNFPKFP